MLQTEMREARRSPEGMCRTEQGLPASRRTEAPLVNNVPRNEQGLPLREAGDDCCLHYRFREETEMDYRRCGWCRDFYGNGESGICVNEKNRAQGKQGKRT